MVKKQRRLCLFVQEDDLCVSDRCCPIHVLAKYCFEMARLANYLPQNDQRTLPQTGTPWQVFETDIAFMVMHALVDEMRYERLSRI